MDGPFIKTITNLDFVPKYKNNFLRKKNPILKEKENQEKKLSFFKFVFFFHMDDGRPALLSMIT